MLRSLRHTGDNEDGWEDIVKDISTRKGLGFAVGGEYKHSINPLELNPSSSGTLTYSVLRGSVFTGADDNGKNFKAMAKGALVKKELEVGPLSVSAGITGDTGFMCGEDGIGLYFLGNGMTLGTKSDISILGFGFSIDFTKIFG